VPLTRHESKGRCTYQGLLAKSARTLGYLLMPLTRRRAAKSMDDHRRSSRARNDVICSTSASSADERSTLFHVSHSLCRPIFAAFDSRDNHKTEPFPQPSRPPSTHAHIFFGRVCYFLRKLTLKPAEKVTRNSAWKTCAKDVENALIFCGLPRERLCKNLRITCGNRVESQRRTLLLPVD
jgi:hypothetical protein